MTLIKTHLGRRSFIKSSALAGGGLVLSFSWLASCQTEAAREAALAMPDEWFEINGFLKIGNNGRVTIMSPNPEIGQNIKTAMPMIVAEELDTDWAQVIVEQAPLNTDIFTRQLAGGSQSIRQGWNGLRMAGATARQMLKEAAAQAWQVPVAEITTSMGVLYHQASNRSAGYGEMASAAAALEVPEEVTLKNREEFTIVGTDQKNVDGPQIVTGQPLFGLDVRREGMLIAMVVHPPAFGMKLKSVNAESVKNMPGIRDVFPIVVYPEGAERQWSDGGAIDEMVAIVGDTTWQCMQAQKALYAEWEIASELESTAYHEETLTKLLNTAPEKAARKDGDVDKAFRTAATVVERTYSAPY
ncbi:MAG TPA: molybdopterin cofactor-binding domain-containing protein, partial [Robiginitalea sp.]|nr:molybdopterin cofactor-binding domain-containing protein [Robiginitalea sp.]